MHLAILRHWAHPYAVDDVCASMSVRAHFCSALVGTMCFAGSKFSGSVLRSKLRSASGKPFCYCGQRHLSDLSAAARVRWAESEGVSWSWYSDKQAYFHICQPCHMECFPNDVRPKVGNRNTRPVASLSHNVVGGNVSRLMCGERLACSSEAGFSSLGPRRPSCCGERSERPGSSGVFEVVLL